MKYILRKLLTLIITLFIVSLLAFLAFPGDSPGPRPPVCWGPTPPRKRWRSWRKRWDWTTRCWFGMAGGWRISSRETGGSLTATTCRSRTWCWRSCRPRPALVLLAFAITVAASFPLGIATARREGSRLDRIITVVNQICMSIPPVFVGILLCFVFGTTLRVFVPGNFVSFADSPGQFSSTCSSRPWRWPCPGWR